MDAQAHPRRRRLGRVLVGAVLLVGLLATVTMGLDQAHATVQPAAQASVRRRWPRPARRIPPAIGVFATLVVLAGVATSLGMLVAGVVVAVGLLAALVLMLPRRLVPPVPAEVLDRLGDRDRLEATNARVKLRNDLRTTALQAIAGLAVLAGALLGFQQLTDDRQQANATRQLTLQGQASERFTRAIDQLGSSRTETRIGGIYGLEQIAQQAPDNRLAVTEVLVAYLHRRATRPPPRRTKPGDFVLGPIWTLAYRAPDIQAALTVLGRRHQEPADPLLDLSNLDLGVADLHGADLHGADLGHADLHGANLVGAHLDGAVLRGANLEQVQLRGADLHGADLYGADLEKAGLRSADLRSASLRGADLYGADLDGADLRGAHLDETRAN